MSPNLSAKQLAELYGDVEDVDLVVGILAERPARGSLVGDVMGCIIGEQFQRVSCCFERIMQNLWPSEGSVLN